MPKCFLHQVVVGQAIALIGSQLLILYKSYLCFRAYVSLGRVDAIAIYI